MSPLDIFLSVDRTAQIILTLFFGTVAVAGGIVVSGLILGGGEAIEPGDGALGFIDEAVVEESATKLPESPASAGYSDNAGSQEPDQITSGSSPESDSVASSATPTPRSTEAGEMTIVTQPVARQEPAPPSTDAGPPSSDSDEATTTGGVAPSAAPPSDQVTDVCDLDYQGDIDRFLAAYPDLVDQLTSSSELSFRFEGSHTMLAVFTPDATSPVFVELEPLIAEVERLLPVLDVEALEGNWFDGLREVVEQVNQCSGVNVNLSVNEALEPSREP